MSRDYGQYCGLARSLDVVGDRWNLLIVRQLLMGPARYGELREGLSSIATNLLTDRLRNLETAGVVERKLSEDAGAITYALTPWGAQLREPINALIRWSTPLMIRRPEGHEFRPEWLLVALPALFEDRAPVNQSVSVGIVVDGGMAQLRATESGIDVGKPDGCDLDAVLTADASLVLGLAAGLLSLNDVAALVRIDGDESAVRTLLEAPHQRADEKPSP
ncbi:winged helix-turn-helix transcriptional regulator [soil metagenome]